MLDYADFGFADAFEDNPEWAQVLCESFLRISRGDWSKDQLAVVVDRWGGGLTFGDVFSFVQVVTMIRSGQAVITEIEVGEEPKGDRFVAQNDSALARLPFPFSGRFWGGNADQDGFVRWSETLDVRYQVDGRELEVALPPGQVPLEVGYTNGVTTLLHVKGSFGVARWPYGSTTIKLIRLLKDVHTDSA